MKNQKTILFLLLCLSGLVSDVLYSQTKKSKTQNTPGKKVNPHPGGAGRLRISDSCATDLINSTASNPGFLTSFTNYDKIIKVHFNDIYTLLYRQLNLNNKLRIEYAVENSHLYMIWRIIEQNGVTKILKILKENPLDTGYHSFQAVKNYDTIIGNYEQIRLNTNQTHYTHLIMTNSFMKSLENLNDSTTTDLDIRYILHSNQTSCKNYKSYSIGDGKLSNIYKYYNANSNFVQYRDASHTFPPYP